MNLAVHGLSGDIRQANSYYDNLHNSTNKFDFVMANPCSTSMGGQERIKDDPLLPVGNASERTTQTTCGYRSSTVPLGGQGWIVWPTLPPMQGQRNGDP